MPQGDYKIYMAFLVIKGRVGHPIHNYIFFIIIISFISIIILYIYIYLFFLVKSVLIMKLSPGKSSV